MYSFARCAPLLRAVLLSWTSLTTAQEPFFRFEDAGDKTGLFPSVGGIAGHGIAWGDVDGDGWPDLYVGTFGGHPYDSKPNQFFRNQAGKFALDDQQQLRVLGRANGAVFADFDNDGDLDLYATNHAINGRTEETKHYSEPNHLFRNEGGGKFTDVSAGSGICPEGFANRSAAVLDFDGDGLLDVLVGECYFQGGTSRTRLYKNKGSLKFEDATAQAGLPDKVTGFGVAAADVNGDTWPDVFIAGRHEGNRMFLNTGQGKFQPLPESHGDFSFEYKDTGDDTACGVCFGDVNHDGLMDLVVGSHYARPWFTGGEPVRLFINKGSDGSLPRFENVTEKVGLVPLPLKCPHVEVQDFDNDGLLDIYTSIVKFTKDSPHPVIFKNMGSKDGLPQFQERTLAVNDFPTEEDKQLASSGKFFAKMEEEHKIVYTAPGPTADYDRDGRLDMFLGNWWVNERSLLLHNLTEGGSYLEVQISPPKGVNPMGIGSLVKVYPAGQGGQPDAMPLVVKEIAVGYGYASGQEAIAHFGLGDREQVDVVVELPCGKGTLTKKNVTANQRIVIE